jgi:hypothetical protein
VRCTESSQEVGRQLNDEAPEMMPDPRNCSAIHEALTLVSVGLHFAAAIAGIALIAMFLVAFVSRWPWQG